jgi:hypothetical protein
MVARLVRVEGQRVTVELTVELSRSMLSTEEAIQAALNEAGQLATHEALKYFDTDGSPLEIGGQVWRTKGQQPKYYQTPYGEVEVSRHVYQRSGGGTTFCPLEREARIIITSTPRFAKQVSAKFAAGPARAVQQDLSENHGRSVAVSYIQRLAEAVGSVVQAKEEDWSYTLPPLEAPVATVAVGVDGTCLLFGEGAWREALVGTLAFYDAQGERQHTIYLGATSEYGKAAFFERLEREIERTKARYPQATYVGIADGAESNWRFLERHTTVSILDFYHAAGYLGTVAAAACPDDSAAQRQWLDERCHQLKHEAGAAEALYQEMVQFQDTPPLSPLRQQDLAAAVTYFDNHRHQMDYAAYRQAHYPIGSGVGRLQNELPRSKLRGIKKCLAWQSEIARHRRVGFSRSKLRGIRPTEIKISSSSSRS